MKKIIHYTDVILGYLVLGYGVLVTYYSFEWIWEANREIVVYVLFGCVLLVIAGIGLIVSKWWGALALFCYGVINLPQVESLSGMGIEGPLTEWYVYSIVILIVALLFFWHYYRAERGRFWLRRLIIALVCAVCVPGILWLPGQYSKYDIAQRKKNLDPKSESLKLYMTGLLSDLGIQNPKFVRQDWVEDWYKEEDMGTGLSYVISADANSMLSDSDVLKDPAYVAPLVFQLERKLLTDGYSPDQNDGSYSRSLIKFQGYSKGNTFCSFHRGCASNDPGPCPRGAYGQIFSCSTW